MRYLFAIAKVADLTLEDDEDTSPRMRTQGSMMEWGFTALAIR